MHLLKFNALWLKSYILEPDRHRLESWLCSLFSLSNENQNRVLRDDVSQRQAEYVLLYSGGQRLSRGNKDRDGSGSVF